MVSSHTGRRLALLVANDTYHVPGLAPLYAPVNDAEQLREVLRDPEVGGFHSSELLINESKAEIERTVERMFRGAGPDDVVLFYFSGHGLRTRQNLYLAASNSDHDLLSSTAVSSSFLKEMIRESAAAAKILLLDCCYSGAFLGPDAVKSAMRVDDVGEQLAAGDGICVLTASSAVEVAEDGVRGADQMAPLSVFTSAVVKGLGTGLADSGSGLISPHDLWRYVHADVRSRTTRQTPSHYGFVKDEIYIARVRRRFSTDLASSDRLRLGGLLGRLVRDADAGLHAADWSGSGRLAVPIGQERRPDGVPGEVVWLDLAGHDSNVLAVGRAGTGKSTFLRSLVGALAVTHTPDEAQIYVLESSNRLGSMGSLPHVAEVVGDDEPDRVSAMLSRIVGEVNNRKKLYRRHNIDSPASLRATRRALPGASIADLFLVIDRWGDFAGLVPELEHTVAHLAGAGPEYGIHVVATARDWRDVPDWLADLLSAHIELRLHRPEESRIDAERAGQLPDGPGWALFQQRRFRLAVPDVRDGGDELVEPADSTDGAADLVERVVAAWPGSSRTTGTASANVDAVATSAASWVPRTPPPEGGGPVDLAALLGVSDPRQVDVATLWQRPPSDSDRLRVPFAVGADGRPVELDLKESAQGGMGPHGLLVGATGSGKSELLRTLVLGLSMTHSSDLLNLLLVDFKGGATFAALEDLPQVAATVTNLSDDLSLVDRLSEVLSGEIVRRQEVLRDAGNYPSHREYERARAAGGDLEPLPALVVMVDEFSELLTAKPDFIDVFVAIGRLGRSLGLHLLLATQRLEEGRLRGLESHLSYRIGLRTFSAQESRAVIGVPDAYELPAVPGSGYLKAGLDAPVGVRAAYVSGASQRPGDANSDALADVVVPALVGRGRPARPIWLPPLQASPPLDALLPPLEASAELGLTAPGLSGRGTLRAPVGIVDRPREQRQDPSWLDLSGANGHLLITGGPQSGKSTLLRSVIASLALTHTAEEVQFYCLDFGGGSLAGLTGLPHVGAVANLSDQSRISRTVADVRNVLQRRERRFAEDRIESMAQYRQLRQDGRAPSDGYGDVFLVVDGWGSLRANFDDLDAEITELAARGLAYGIHLMATATRTIEVRASLRTLLGSQLELRLGDPMDSEIDRKAARNVPLGAPGRGLAQSKEQFLAALPRIDGNADPESLREGVDDLCRRVREAWPGRPAEPVRVLPDDLPYDVLLGLEDGVEGVAIGVDSDTLKPVAVDFAVDPHFLIFGDGESGKSNLLRVLVRQLARQHTPDQAQVLLVDHRRSLIDCDDVANLLGYGFNASKTESLVETVAESVAKRLPGADVTPAQLKTRSWWSGPEVYVVVDDYDLVVTSEGNPLRRLVDLVGLGRDIGLHLVVVRASGGASRALYEPVLARIRDMGSPGVLLSGDKYEGALLGNVRSERMPAGRGHLVTRRDGKRLIQTAHLPATDQPRG
jgi:S-DNA-T family DNA segregation ATPase FtsK/SpoIIIE